MSTIGAVSQPTPARGAPLVRIEQLTVGFRARSPSSGRSISRCMPANASRWSASRVPASR